VAKEFLNLSTLCQRDLNHGRRRDRRSLIPIWNPGSSVWKEAWTFSLGIERDVEVRRSTAVWCRRSTSGIVMGNTQGGMCTESGQAVFRISVSVLVSVSEF